MIGTHVLRHRSAESYPTDHHKNEADEELFQPPVRLPGPSWTAAYHGCSHQREPEQSRRLETALEAGGMGVTERGRPA